MIALKVSLNIGVVDDGLPYFDLASCLWMCMKYFKTAQAGVVGFEAVC